jgi:ATP-dependent 26S proteasome regulatory subunit
MLKTITVDRSWIDDLKVKIEVYGAAALSIPLSERGNLDPLIQTLADAGIWQIRQLPNLDSLESDFHQIAQTKAQSNLWIIKNLVAKLNSCTPDQRYTLTEAIVNGIYAIRGSSTKILFIDCDLDFPAYLAPIVPGFELPLPTPQIIAQIVAEFGIQSDKLPTIAAGLGAEEIRTGIRLAIASTSSRTPALIEAEVLKYKISELKKLGLEFMGQLEADDFGGLDVVRDLIETVKRDFTPAARQFKIKLPKGILLTGPPGTGKSHTAKCIAKRLNLPLISVGIDMIKAGGALAMKKLLQRIDMSAPAVVYFDEVDKFFNNGDKAILGVLLTWLQEKRSLTYVIATLNRLNDVPVEFTRIGRFDRLFWVGFANERERYDIVKLYAKEYDSSYATEDGRLTDEEWIDLINNTNNYTGAELQFMVNEAARIAFGTVVPGQTTLQITAQALKQARNNIVPLFVRNPEGILEIEKQARKFCESASSGIKDFKFQVGKINIFGDN